MILNDVFITYVIQGNQGNPLNEENAFMDNFATKKIKIKIKAPFYVFNNLKLEIIKFRNMFDKMKMVNTTPNITMLKIYNFIREIVCSDKILAKISDVFKLINNDAPIILAEEDRKKHLINDNKELWSLLNNLSVNIWHRYY